jgi:transposase
MTAIAQQGRRFGYQRLHVLLMREGYVVAIRTKLYNQIRGMLKTFGVVLAPGKGGTFEQAVLAECRHDLLVRSAIHALLEVWRIVGERRRALDLQLMRLARAHEVCRRIATIPGVGAITALTFLTTIDDPRRFSRSTDVGAFLGLTPRRYQSGEVDIAGRISKAGDGMSRSLLFEAASALMTRVRRDSVLRSCGLQLMARIGSR